MRERMKFWVRRTSCYCWNKDEDIKDMNEYKRVCTCKRPCCEIVEINSIQELLDRFSGDIISKNKNTFGIGYDNTITKKTIDKEIDGSIEIYDDYRE